jgi:hypothetical protein
MNFEEVPKSDAFFFRFGRETLLDQETISQEKHGYGPIVATSCNEKLECGLGFSFQRNDLPVIFKSMETVIPNQNYYFVVVIDGKRYQIYDGNRLPKEGTKREEISLGPDLLSGPHLERKKDGLVTTSREIVTTPGTFSVFYLSETLPVGYIGEHFDLLKEVMDGYKEYIPDFSGAKGGGSQPTGGPEANPRPPSEAKPEPTSETKPPAPVPKPKQRRSRPTAIREAPFLRKMTVVVPQHICFRSLRQRQVFPPKTRYTLCLLLKTGQWPLEKNYLYTLLNGHRSEVSNPCVLLNVDNPGIVVKSNGSTAENICQFNHPIKRDSYYFYVLIFNYNRLSIIYRQKAVKFCTNYQQEPFERPRHLYAGPNLMSSSQGCDVVLSVGYFPYALREGTAIREYNRIKEKLLRAQQESLKPKRSRSVEAPKKDTTDSIYLKPEPPAKRETDRSKASVKTVEEEQKPASYSLPDSVTSTRSKGEKRSLFKEFDSEDYEMPHQVSEQNYFKIE